MVMASSSSSSSSPHVVVFPLPTQGHVHPMMDLSTKLMEMAIKVTFITTEDVCRRLNLHHPHPQGDDTSSPLFSVMQIPDGLAPDVDQYTVQSGLAFTINSPSVQTAFCSLLDAAHLRHPVTCLISDSFVFASKSAAVSLGIPWVFFWTQSASLFSIGYLTYIERPRLFACNADHSSVVKPTMQLMSDSKLFPPSLGVKDLPTYIQVDDTGSMEYALLSEHFKAAASEGCWRVLCNSFSELESDVVDHFGTRYELPIVTVGPLLPSTYFSTQEERGSSKKLSRGTSLWKETESCLGWLNKQAPSSVLYIGFGSMAMFSDLQMEETMAGVLASGQPFLWACRHDDLRRKLVTLAEKPLTLAENSRGMIVAWAPQLEVLAHEAVGGFLSHTGWNSVLESVVAGVPVVSLPYCWDQPTHGRLVADKWHVGVALQKREPDGVAPREEVERAVRLVMQEPPGTLMRERARALREASRTAVKEGGSSHANLWHFAEALWERTMLPL